MRILLTQFGCLLPALIFFNFFFGWIFLPPLIWLAIEAGLVLLFFLTIFVFARKLSRTQEQYKRKDVIDTEGKVEE